MAQLVKPKSQKANYFSCKYAILLRVSIQSILVNTFGVGLLPGYGYQQVPTKPLPQQLQL